MSNPGTHYYMPADSAWGTAHLPAALSSTTPYCTLEFPPAGGRPVTEDAWGCDPCRTGSSSTMYWKTGGGSYCLLKSAFTCDSYGNNCVAHQPAADSKVSWAANPIPMGAACATGIDRCADGSVCGARRWCVRQDQDASGDVTCSSTPKLYSKGQCEVAYTHSGLCDNSPCYTLIDNCPGNPALCDGGRGDAYQLCLKAKNSGNCAGTPYS